MSSDVSVSHTKWFADGRLHVGVGIEDTFIPQERVGQRKLDEYELTQHYHLWEEDLELAARSGATLIRWGVPWYLVEKVEGEFDFSWTDRVVARMQELGLRCVVDLMHYGTPMWLENSFLAPRYPEAVARYARAVADRYAGVLTDYTPLNEPAVNAIWCGRDGRWPPYLSGHGGFVAVLLPLVRGMVATQNALREVDPEMTIVHVDAGFRWVGDSFPDLPAEVLDEWRFLALDLLMGRVDADHPMHAYLLEHGAVEADLEYFRANACVPDVVGVNYYPAFTTQRYVDGVETPVEAGGEGLVDLVSTYAARYALPVAVTETSRSVSDVEEKSEWVREVFRSSAVLRARGVPLVGVFWFPVLDLVDWSYRDGVGEVDDYLMQFGLVDLVRGADNVLHRRPNGAFEVFRSEVAALLAGG